jgi:hypothetical protein
MLGSDSVQRFRDELSSHPLYIVLPVAGCLVLAVILASLLKGPVSWLLYPVAIIAGLYGGHALIQHIDPNAPGPGPIVFNVNVPNPSIGSGNGSGNGSGTTVLVP